MDWSSESRSDSPELAPARNGVVVINRKKKKRVGEIAIVIADLGGGFDSKFGLGKRRRPPYT